MSNNDLKHTLRPLIKECVKEVIFEEGFLSGIVTEVLMGVQAAGVSPIMEASVDPNDSGVDIAAFFGSSQNWSKMV